MIAIGTLELLAIPIRALHRLLSAFSFSAHRVPSTGRAPRLAALAARCIACISAAPPPPSLAREAVPLDILAADVILAHTRTAAALVSVCALEHSSVVIHALDWWLPTP